MALSRGSTSLPNRVMLSPAAFSSPGASTPDRLLRLAKNYRRVGRVSLQQFVNLLRPCRIDLETHLGGVGKELAVLHRRRQSFAQRTQAVGRNSRGFRQRTAEQKLLEQHFE